MKSKIINQINQMTKEELKTLYKSIKDDYRIVEEGGMFRDDIKDKIFELIKTLFADSRFIVQEKYSFVELNMDAVDVQALSDAIVLEFDLEEIEFSKVMEWQKVKDVVSYVENTLECALHDIEDN